MKAHYTIVALLVMTLMVSCAKFEPPLQQPNTRI